MGKKWTRGLQALLHRYAFLKSYSWITLKLENKLISKGKCGVQENSRNERNYDRQLYLQNHNHLSFN